MARKANLKKLREERIAEAMKHRDVLGAGAEKRKELTPEEDQEAVMKEFKRGTLRAGGSGKKVKNRKQAIAIMLSESSKL